MTVVLSSGNRIQLHGEKPFLARAKFVAEHTSAPNFSENLVGAASNVKNASLSQCVYIMWMKRE